MFAVLLNRLVRLFPPRSQGRFGIEVFVQRKVGIDSLKQFLLLQNKARLILALVWCVLERVITDDTVPLLKPRHIGQPTPDIRVLRPRCENFRQLFGLGVILNQSNRPQCNPCVTCLFHLLFSLIWQFEKKRD